MSLQYPSLLDLIKKPIHFCAFGFASGLIRPAPGTWGSVLATLIAIPLMARLHFSIIGIVFLILTFIVGCYLCGKTAKDLGVHDHGGIVWDEFVGIWMIFILFPSNLMNDWGNWYFLVGFILFRIFDIIKPAPIRQVDRKAPGGFGIMIDDVLASVYALIILYLISFFS